MKVGLSACFLLDLEVGCGNVVCALVRELLVRQIQPEDQDSLSDSWVAGLLSSPGSNQSRHEECARPCRLERSDCRSDVSRFRMISE